MSQSMMPVAAASKVSTDFTTEDEKNISILMSPPDIFCTLSTNSAASLPDAVSGAQCVWMRSVVDCAEAETAAPTVSARAEAAIVNFFVRPMFFLP